MKSKMVPLDFLDEQWRCRQENAVSVEGEEMRMGFFRFPLPSQLESLQASCEHPVGTNRK